MQLRMAEATIAAMTVTQDLEHVIEAAVVVIGSSDMLQGTGLAFAGIMVRGRMPDNVPDLIGMRCLDDVEA